jgi:hypothetical protein
LSNWAFYIDGIEVNEPVNWDVFTYTLQRSDQYWGLENIYSQDKLQLYGPAADAVREKFNLFGFDGSCDFVANELCNGKITENFVAVINLLTYVETNSNIEVTLEESLFKRTFLNRLDVQVNFNKNISVGGAILPPADLFALGLHSKAIKYTGILNFSDQFLRLSANSYSAIPSGYDTTGTYVNSFTLSDFFDSPQYWIVPLFDQLTTDLTNLQVPTVNYVKAASYAIPPLVSAPIFSTPIAGDFIFKIVIKADIVTTHGQFCNLRIVTGTGLTSGLISNELTIQNRTGNSMSFDVNYTVTFHMNAGEGAWVYFDQHFTGVEGDSVLNYSITYHKNTTIANSNQIYVEDVKQTVFPTNCTAIDIFNAFKRICQTTTDQLDCFRSNFFGRPDLFPFPTTAGCGAYTAITNGKNIRNMKDILGNKFPITMSFNDLFNAANSIWCLGMRVETDSYGRSFVRIEHRDYFYNSESVSNIQNVSDLQRSVSTDIIFNSVVMGYEKFNLNSGGLNGIDEFNSQHTYVLPLINIKNELSQISKFIAGGYIIELTRRQQYVNAQTKDFETDDANFFICTNRERINDGTIYTPTGTYLKNKKGFYDLGTVSERWEQFVSYSGYGIGPAVYNIISPTTAYNLRISPGRMMLWWYGLLATSLIPKVNPVIQFQSAQCNFHESDKMSEESCDQAGVLVTQNEDITITSLKDATAVHKPILLTFTYPIKFSDFLYIKKNSNKAIQVSCSDGTAVVGFIKQLDYEPNAEGGIGSFVLLEATCQPGSFDSGFNIGFDIGTC